MQFHKGKNGGKPYFSIATIETPPNRFDIRIGEDRDTIFDEEAFNAALSKRVSTTVKRGHHKTSIMAPDLVAQQLEKYSKPLWKIQKDESIQQKPGVTKNQLKKLKMQQRQQLEIPEEGPQEEEIQEISTLKHPKDQQPVVQTPQSQKLKSQTLEVPEEREVVYAKVELL